MTFDRRRFVGELWPSLDALTTDDLSELDRRRADSTATDVGWNPMVHIRNLTIVGDDESLNVAVRLYSRKDRQQGAAILHIHGGGFVLGNLDFEHRRCVKLTLEAECLVVSVDYRLAPEHPYPAGLDDCSRALDWLHDHAEDMDVDVTRIGVAGSSAGGCPAAGLALRARDRGGLPLAFQLLIYPVTDCQLSTPSITTFWDGPGFSGHNATEMWSLYLSHGAVVPDEYASPALAQDLTGLPPAFVSIVEFDPLRDEGIEYARRLIDANVEVEVREFPGTWHGFDLHAPDSTTAKEFTGAEVTAARRLSAVAPDSSTMRSTT